MRSTRWSTQAGIAARAAGHRAWTSPRAGSRTATCGQPCRSTGVSDVSCCPRPAWPGRAGRSTTPPTSGCGVAEARPPGGQTPRARAARRRAGDRPGWGRPTQPARSRPRARCGRDPAPRVATAEGVRSGDVDEHLHGASGGVLEELVALDPALEGNVMRLQRAEADEALVDEHGRLAEVIPRVHE